MGSFGFEGREGSQLYNADEFGGESDSDLHTGKTTKIKAGALFPEDCPMDDKILKTESALFAKTILQTISSENGTSLYDHLCIIVRQLIDERVPIDAADYIEELSAQTKLKRYGMIYKDTEITSKEITSKFVAEAEATLKTWETDALPWASKIDEEEDNITEYPNTLKVQGYLQQIDLGLPKEEFYRIALSLKKLFSERQLENPRFWGKIIGTKKVYYIVEFSVNEETDIETDVWIPPQTEDDDENQDFQSMVSEAIQEGDFPVLKGDATLERAGKAVTNDELLEAYKPKSKGPVTPTTTEEVETEVEYPGEGDYLEFLGEGEEMGNRKKGGGLSAEKTADRAQWEMYQKELVEDFPVAIQIPDPEEIPWEVQGHGVNRRGFYVCNDLEGDWILLPLVTPQQINKSRSIRWALTGNLNAKIMTYPVFAGREGNYLRALLARITAGAHISPKGYYKSGKMLDEEDDEEELSDIEEELAQDVTRQVFGDDSVVRSTNYRIVTIKNLLFEDANGWVHHASYILPQGRTVWWKSLGRKKFDGEGDEDDETEDEGEDSPDDGEPKEVSLPLFSSASLDTFSDRLYPWSVRSSSEVFSEFQIAGIRSNVWPGAVAYCTQKGVSDNIYIGDGLKFEAGNWTPSFTDTPKSEYPEGPELREMPDPPIEIEQEYINAIIEAQFAREAKNKKAEEKNKSPSQDGFYYDEEEGDEYDTEADGEGKDGR